MRNCGYKCTRTSMSSRFCHMLPRGHRMNVTQIPIYPTHYNGRMGKGLGLYHPTMGIVTHKRPRVLKTTLLDASPGFRLGHQHCTDRLLSLDTNDSFYCDPSRVYLFSSSVLSYKGLKDNGSKKRCMLPWGCSKHFILINVRSIFVGSQVK